MIKLVIVLLAGLVLAGCSPSDLRPEGVVGGDDLPADAQARGRQLIDGLAARYGG